MGTEDYGRKRWPNQVATKRTSPQEAHRAFNFPQTLLGFVVNRAAASLLCTYVELMARTKAFA